MQERAGGGPLSRFNAVLVSSTSLACKRKPEVGFYCVSTLFVCPPGISLVCAPPAPPSRTEASWKCFDIVRASSTSLAWGGKLEVGHHFIVSCIFLQYIFILFS